MPPAQLQFNAAADRRGQAGGRANGRRRAPRWPRTPGFSARSEAVEAAPTWKGIVEVADEHDASLIVLGSHGRSGLAGVLIGSVAEAVAAHSRRSVLIVHRRD